MSSEEARFMDDPLWAYYRSINIDMDTRGLSISEVQQALTASGISESYTLFSDEATRLVCVILDRNFDRRMGFEEFREMWNLLNAWKNIFRQHDVDRSGTIVAHELANALTSLGFRLSPRALGGALKKFNNHGGGRLSFDDFITCCLTVQFLTRFFAEKDVEKNGNATFTYYQFLDVMLKL